MNAAMASLNISLPALQFKPRNELSLNFSDFPTSRKIKFADCDKTKRPTSFYCYNSNAYTVTAPSETEGDTDDEGDAPAARVGAVPPVRRRTSKYRKLYPGEKEGITEEMRFVAMKLRNSGKPKKKSKRGSGGKKEVESETSDCSGDEERGQVSVELEEEKNESGNQETWEPSIEGFIKYLVDSKLVFSTIERIVDESDDVSYAYFRKTGLERSDRLSKDLQWFREGGNVIPEPSNLGLTYTKYLEELAETTPPLFLCHFYNIYFSHIAGGQVIGEKVSEKLFDGRKLEFYSWEGQEEELFKGVRENLNMVGEHWSRYEKNKCLRETTKAFQFLGQIVRLIIL